MVETDLGAACNLLLAVIVFLALMLVITKVELVSHCFGLFAKTEVVEIIEFGDGIF
jgi:hypothetical protein